MSLLFSRFFVPATDRSVGPHDQGIGGVCGGLWIAWYVVLIGNFGQILRACDNLLTIWSNGVLEMASAVVVEWVQSIGLSWFARTRTLRRVQRQSGQTRRAASRDDELGPAPYFDSHSPHRPST